MNKIVCFLLLSSSLFGKIVEIKTAKEIAPHLQADTLILFDIDNTIMHPAQELGNDQWFRHRLRCHAEQGLPFKKALQKTLNEWAAVQYVTSVKIVEEEIRHVIDGFQKKHLPLIGLTSRGYPLAYRTVEQLTDLGVDLSVSSPTKQTIYFPDPDHIEKGVIFYEGILFTAGTHKGDTFDQFLQKTNLKPKRILFVNDKTDHLEELEHICQKKGIEFTGLRYGYLDHKVTGFRPDLADLQWKHFINIPSDEELSKKLAK